MRSFLTLKDYIVIVVLALLTGGILNVLSGLGSFAGAVDGSPLVYYISTNLYYYYNPAYLFFDILFWPFVSFILVITYKIVTQGRK
jgi:hypothetical protein